MYVDRQKDAVKEEKILGSDQILQGEVETRSSISLAPVQTMQSTAVARTYASTYGFPAGRRNEEESGGRKRSLREFPRGRRMRVPRVSLS